LFDKRTPRSALNDLFWRAIPSDFLSGFLTGNKYVSAGLVKRPNLEAARKIFPVGGYPYSWVDAGTMYTTPNCTIDLTAWEMILVTLIRDNYSLAGIVMGFLPLSINRAMFAKTIACFPCEAQRALSCVVVNPTRDLFGYEDTFLVSLVSKMRVSVRYRRNEMRISLLADKLQPFMYDHLNEEMLYVAALRKFELMMHDAIRILSTSCVLTAFEKPRRNSREYRGLFKEQVKHNFDHGAYHSAWEFIQEVYETPYFIAAEIYRSLEMKAYSCFRPYSKTHDSRIMGNIADAIVSPAMFVAYYCGAVGPYYDMQRGSRTESGPVDICAHSLNCPSKQQERAMIEFVDRIRSEMLPRVRGFELLCGVGNVRSELSRESDGVAHEEESDARTTVTDDTLNCDSPILAQSQTMELDGSVDLRYGNYVEECKMAQISDSEPLSPRRLYNDLGTVDLTKEDSDDETVAYDMQKEREEKDLGCECVACVAQEVYSKVKRKCRRWDGEEERENPGPPQEPLVVKKVQRT
jgi:hypothetical protein